MRSFKPYRLIVEAEVRYWEDAIVNGKRDTEDGDNIPLKRGGLWQPVIELETGRVIGWPQGTTARIHYKVCDAGRYYLQGIDDRIIKWLDDYVPEDLLCVGDSGYGDYIIMYISADGLIEGWKQPQIDFSEWETLEDDK